MTTKNLPKPPDPQAASEGGTTNSSSVSPSSAVETITLSHHLNIEGTSYQPGAKVRVSADYARRLRRQGYVART